MILEFLRLRKKTFEFEPFIYVKRDGTILRSIGTRIKWLEKISVKAHTERAAFNKAFDLLKKKYPEYKGHIYIF